MIKQNIFSYLRDNSYPGRSIVLGRSTDGKNAVIAYFIMGRSENSRNRIFAEDGNGIITQAYDPSRLTDPSLVIYSPVKVLGHTTIVTNGAQTDTIYDYLRCDKAFEEALRTWSYEPDAPHYTPRISALMTVKDNTMCYRLSILKSSYGNPKGNQRFFYEYDYAPKGEGHIIHTYERDAEPLPSYQGEPKRIAIEGNIDEFGDRLWDSQNSDNKISLFVRYINIATGQWVSKIYNKNR